MTDILREKQTELMGVKTDFQQILQSYKINVNTLYAKMSKRYAELLKPLGTLENAVTKVIKVLVARLKLNRFKVREGTNRQQAIATMKPLFRTLLTTLFASKVQFETTKEFIAFENMSDVIVF